jgi:hypothetical protein
MFESPKTVQTNLSSELKILKELPKFHLLNEEQEAVLNEVNEGNLVPTTFVSH